MAVGIGRYGSVSVAPGNNPVVILGIAEFLRDSAEKYKDFNKEMRIASQDVAQLLVDKAKAEASTVTRSRQATEVMKGMKAQRDRIPTVSLRSNEGFVSHSRPNRLRKVKVTRGDVFFGAEFGGGTHGAGNRTSAHSEIKRKGTLVRTSRKGGGNTTQFLRHRGRKGYFFWPAVRANKEEIAQLYLKAIDRVLEGLAKRNLGIG